MKNRILSLLTMALVGITMFAHANVKENNTPAAVQSAFTKLFPNAIDQVWEMDEQAHIVFFTENNIVKYCRLDATGKWIEKGEEFAAELPKGIVAGIAAKYESAEVSEKYSVIMANKKKGFLVLVDVEGDFIELLLSDKGEVLRERTLPNADEDLEEEDSGDDDDDWK